MGNKLLSLKVRRSSQQVLKVEVINHAIYSMDCMLLLSEPYAVEKCKFLDLQAIMLLTTKTNVGQISEEHSMSIIQCMTD